jgi:hypothetical protein
MLRLRTLLATATIAAACGADDLIAGRRGPALEFEIATIL